MPLHEDEIRARGDLVHHGVYSCRHYGTETVYDAGVVRRISLHCLPDEKCGQVTVCFADGEEACWQAPEISSYLFQFSAAVSRDGHCLFVPTWARGLYALELRTGKRLWKTKSRRGVTHTFVMEDRILCHQHERALQLLDIRTGEVLAEKRPASAWGFTAIDARHIVCQVTARRWEIIDTRTLHTCAAFSHRDFTGGHTDFLVSRICREGDALQISGFQNVWDDSVQPPVRLPNRTFTHQLPLHLPG